MDSIRGPRNHPLLPRWFRSICHACSLTAGRLSILLLEHPSTFFCLYWLEYAAVQNGRARSHSLFVFASVHSLAKTVSDRGFFPESHHRLDCALCGRQLRLFSWILLHHHLQFSPSFRFFLSWLLGRTLSSPYSRQFSAVPTSLWWWSRFWIWFFKEWRMLWV